MSFVRFVVDGVCPEHRFLDEMSRIVPWDLFEQELDRGIVRKMGAADHHTPCFWIQRNSQRGSGIRKTDTSSARPHDNQMFNNVYEALLYAIETRQSITAKFVHCPQPQVLRVPNQEVLCLKRH